MWTRAQLKKEARTVLRQCYVNALTVSVIASVFNHTDKIASKIMSSIPGVSANINSAAAATEFSFGMVLFFLGFVTVSTILSSLLMAFVAGPIIVGEHRFFLESTQYRFDIREMLYGFTSGKYLNIVVTMIFKEILLALWTMLFVIPGIIKSFSYFFVPFILAENPGLSPSQAIKISCRITKGNKWEIFLLELSFVLWYILGALAFGIGIFFVMPYHRASQAQLYVALRSRALDKGVISLEELEYGTY